MRRVTRKNRKLHAAVSPMHRHLVKLAGIGMLLLCAVIVHIMAQSSCDQQLKLKGDKERQLALLEEERVRQNTLWNELQTPEKMERVLRRNGLAMRLPHADQVVHMRADGRPVPGQLSLGSRSAPLKVAMNNGGANAKVAMNGNRRRRVR